MSNRRKNRTGRRLGARVAVLTCIAVLGLAGCAGSSDDDGGGSGDAASGTADTQEAAPRESADAARNSLNGSNGKTSPSENLTQVALRDRAIERHGSLQLASEDVDKARDSVIADIEGFGGYVADERASTDDGTLDHVRLELVVPTNDFDDAMDSSAGAGEIVSREQSAKDVTDKVVDVNSRVENAKSSLRRIRQLLGRAQKLGDVIRLESVLGQRESDLESLQARQKSLRQRTSTATIDVTIRKAGKGRPVKNDAEDDAGFLAGLEAGWSGLQTAWTSVATVVGAVLPFALSLGIPVAIIALFVRRMLHRRTATT